MSDEDKKPWGIGEFRCDPMELERGDVVAYPADKKYGFALGVVDRKLPPSLRKGELVVRFCSGRELSWETVEGWDGEPWVSEKTCRIPRKDLRRMLTYGRQKMIALPFLEAGEHPLDIKIYRVDPTELKRGDIVARTSNHADRDYEIAVVSEVDTLSTHSETFSVRFCCAPEASWEVVESDEGPAVDGQAVHIPRPELYSMVASGIQTYDTESTDGTSAPMGCPHCGLLHTSNEPCPAFM